MSLHKKFYFYLFAIILTSTISYGQSRYLGVYNPTVKPGCGSSYCHETVVNSWEKTGHATAHPANSSHYGYNCLQCHNTGWNPNVDNGGADEYVNYLPGESPDYEITDSTKFNLVKDVQCEACHGPVGDKDGILDWNHTTRVTSYSAEACGQCHQGEHHPYIDEWQQSAHASGAPAFLKNRETNSECFYCHFAQDFVAFLENPDYNAAEFQPDGGDENLADVTCVACHNPHGTDNPANLRVAVGNDKVVCDVCHTVQEREIDFNDTPHHTTSECLTGSDLFGWQYADEDYGQAQSFHKLIRNRCIACHVNMEGEGDFGSATGHTFKPRVEACAGCHSDYYSVVDTSDHEHMFDYRGAQTATLQLVNELEAALAAASPDDSTTDEFKKALYNLEAVKSEGSMGIHNTKLDQKLLNDALYRLQTSAVKTDSNVPSDYNLSQNYPNPFNPTTQIKFSVPQTSNVKITIYNAIGKEVAVLVNRQFDAGSYTYTWNASNLSSGIYFYRMETISFVEAKKMMLIK